ncbi:formylglycine-generating enzyme family protein [Enhygromyxa salina]|uniref:Hercynine oxygenase n=1 Tax=Enhygromyxa salina TaxID=215803 RepID=A0A2S9YC48_9BACT|nr:Hercynine oxygenase [Enhygromyxa salina]
MTNQTKTFRGANCVQHLKRWLEDRTGDASPLDCVAWACSSCGTDRYGLWIEIVICAESTRYRWVPPGSFTMGLDDDGTERAYLVEVPSHTVILSAGFWVEDVPCTQGLWKAVMGREPSHFRAPDRPVESVSWDLVQEFIRKLRAHVSGFSCRLPTEAEWEYTCGHLDGCIEEAAWVHENSAADFDLAGVEYVAPGPSNSKRRYGPRGTHPVRGKKPNRFGVYDLLGNVLEWCDDAPRVYSLGVIRDPRGTGSDERVLRGGDWDTKLCETRPTRRFSLDKRYGGGNIGFRLVVPARDGSVPW